MEQKKEVYCRYCKEKTEDCARCVKRKGRRLLLSAICGCCLHKKSRWVKKVPYSRPRKTSSTDEVPPIPPLVDPIVPLELPELTSPTDPTEMIMD
jgi:hypothetical protein